MATVPPDPSFAGARFSSPAAGWAADANARDRGDFRLSVALHRRVTGSARPRSISRAVAEIVRRWQAALNLIAEEHRAHREQLYDASRRARVVRPIECLRS